MRTQYTNLKEQSISSEIFEKSELMQLFESELHNAYTGKLDLINAILAND